MEGVNDVQVIVDSMITVYQTYTKQFEILLTDNIDKVFHFGSTSLRVSDGWTSLSWGISVNIFFWCRLLLRLHSSSPNSRGEGNHQNHYREGGEMSFRSHHFLISPISVSLFKNNQSINRFNLHKLIYHDAFSGSSFSNVNIFSFFLFFFYHVKWQNQS